MSFNRGAFQFALVVMVSALPLTDASACSLPEKIGLQHPVEGAIISIFGVRRHPLLSLWKLHPGIDYAGPVGDPIIAAAPGKVLSAGYSGEYGNRIVVVHGNGFATIYSQLTNKLLVRENDCIVAGQHIGHLGSTGLSTEPHLHFEVLRNGTAIDPLPLLPHREMRPDLLPGHVTDPDVRPDGSPRGNNSSPTPSR